MQDGGELDSTSVDGDNSMNSHMDVFPSEDMVGNIAQMDTLGDAHGSEVHTGGEDMGALDESREEVDNHVHVHDHDSHVLDDNMALLYNAFSHELAVYLGTDLA